MKCDNITVVDSDEEWNVIILLLLWQWWGMKCDNITVVDSDDEWNVIILLLLTVMMNEMWYYCCCMALQVWQWWWMKCDTITVVVTMMMKEMWYYHCCCCVVLQVWQQWWMNEPSPRNIPCALPWRESNSFLLLLFLSKWHNCLMQCKGKIWHSVAFPPPPQSHTHICI